MSDVLCLELQEQLTVCYHDTVVIMFFRIPLRRMNVKAFFNIYVYFLFIQISFISANIHQFDFCAWQGARKVSFTNSDGG